MPNTEVLVKFAESICHIQINQPKLKNALNQETYAGLADAFDAAIADDNVLVILLSGADGNFTSGNDLGEFANEVESISASQTVRFMKTLYHCEKPVVAAAEGVAVGIGTTLLLHCDLVYAHPETKFLLPFNRLGLVAEYGCSYLLPRLAGRAKAMELVLLAEPFGAKAAEDIGLVTSIADDVMAKAWQAAVKLVALPIESTRLNKKLLRQENDLSLEQVMDQEIGLFAEGLKGAAFREAYNAFIEKRQPNFSKLE